MGRAGEIHADGASTQYLHSKGCTAAARSGSSTRVPQGRAVCAVTSPSRLEAGLIEPSCIPNGRGRDEGDGAIGWLGSGPPVPRSARQGGWPRPMVVDMGIGKVMVTDIASQPPRARWRAGYRNSIAARQLGPPTGFAPRSALAVIVPRDLPGPCVPKLPRQPRALPVAAARGGDVVMCLSCFHKKYARA